MLFWLSLIVAGMVKGWYTVMTDMPFQQVMERVVPFLAAFAVWGLVLFTGITVLAWQAVRALWWKAFRERGRHSSVPVTSLSPTNLP